MHVTLDYLVTGLIIIIILTFSSSFILPFTSVTLQHVQEEQINPLAERLLDKIILTPGEPSDWWDIYKYREEAGIADFGLGLLKGDSTEPYVLDPNKVSRLISRPFELTPKMIAKLLGLTWDGSPEHLKYNFKLKIIPALNITIIPDENKRVSIRNKNNENDDIYTAFNILIKGYDGIPAFNTNFKAIYLLAGYKGGVGSHKGDVKYAISIGNGRTDLNGASYVDFSDNPDINEWINGNRGKLDKSTCTLIVYANYFGIKSFKSYFPHPTNTLNSYIIGDKLFVEFPEAPDNPAAYHIKDLIQVGGGFLNIAEIVDLNNPDNPGESPWVVNKGGKSYRIYRIVSGIDPSLNTNLLFFIKQARGGFSVVIYPPEEICIGGEGEGLRVVSSHRFCKIGDFTYVVELSLWRMAE